MRVIASFFSLTTLLAVAYPSQAQSWIPTDLHSGVVLIERFRYQDPGMTLVDVDESYEDQKDEFIEITNDQLEPYNQRLDSLFRTCNVKNQMVDLGKVDEQFPDVRLFRYMLKRDVFFGKKKALDPKTQKVTDQSYFAYRYYFYDRITKKSFPYYYYSGSQWDQLKRIVFWLNQLKR